MVMMKVIDKQPKKQAALHTITKETRAIIIKCVYEEIHNGMPTAFTPAIKNLLT